MIINKPENPYFTIIRGVLPKGFDFKKYDIYYIKGFEATENNLSVLELSYTEDYFIDILMKLKYNSQSDNINVYYFKKAEENHAQIYLISDPLELYEKEQIIKQFDYLINVRVLSNYEKIN